MGIKAEYPEMHFHSLLNIQILYVPREHAVFAILNILEGFFVTPGCYIACSSIYNKRNLVVNLNMLFSCGDDVFYFFLSLGQAV